MKRFIVNFLDKMEYFFVNLYEKSLDSWLEMDRENNFLIIAFKIFCPVLIHIFAFISFVIVLLLLLPIIFILDLIDIFIRIFHILLKR